MFAHMQMQLLDSCVSAFDCVRFDSYATSRCTHGSMSKSTVFWMDRVGSTAQKQSSYEWTFWFDWNVWLSGMSDLMVSLIRVIHLMERSVWFEKDPWLSCFFYSSDKFDWVFCFIRVIHLIEWSVLFEWYVLLSGLFDENYIFDSNYMFDSSDMFYWVVFLFERYIWLSGLFIRITCLIEWSSYSSNMFHCVVYTNEWTV